MAYRVFLNIYTMYRLEVDLRSLGPFARKGGVPLTKNQPRQGPGETVSGESYLADGMTHGELACSGRVPLSLIQSP